MSTATKNVRFGRLIKAAQGVPKQRLTQRTAQNLAYAKLMYTAPKTSAKVAPKPVKRLTPSAEQLADKVKQAEKLKGDV